MAQTFPHVEDYVEFLGGYRNIHSTSMFFTLPTTPTISLARYDVSVVDSLGQQTAYSQTPYTERQAVLAVRLVEKYRRQLAKHDIEVPQSLDQFRLGIRKIDYTREVTIQDQRIVVKCPYDAGLIESVQNLKKTGQGDVKFDHDTKTWRMGMTEYILNWVITVAPKYNLTVSDELRQLYAQMMEVEKTPYAIELVDQGDQLGITNAPRNLIEYIQEHLGGFSPANLLALVDNSAVLGYKVSKELQYIFQAEWGTDPIYTRRSVTYPSGKTLEGILEYARSVNRLPVHVYRPGIPQPNSDEIVYLDGRTPADVKPRLLVTNTSLMIGIKRQSWMVNAEKIVVLP